MVTTSISFSTIEYTMNLSLIVDKRTINLTNINHLKKRYFIGKEIFKTYGRINFLCVIEIDKDLFTYSMTNYHSIMIMI